VASSEDELAPGPEEQKKKKSSLTMQKPRKYK
jgi:hypothetical protein